MSPIMDTSETLGRRIRDARKMRRLSLRALAESSGVSRSMISEIERGTKSPTIAVLAAVSEALHLPISVLIEGVSASARTAHLTRADEQRTVQDPSGVERTSLGRQFDESAVEFVRFTLPPSTASGIFVPHRPGTLERIHIERGTINVAFGDEQLTLRDGETLAFEASVTHSLANVGKKTAVLYLVIERR